MEEKLVSPREFDETTVNVFLETIQPGEEREWRNKVLDEYMEIIIVNNGTLTVEYNQKLQSANAGQGFFINAGVTHSRRADNNQACAFYSVIFSPFYLLKTPGNGQLADKYLTPLLECEALKCRRLDDSNLYDEAAIDRINNIIAVNMIRKPGYELLIASHLYMFLFSMLDYVNGKGEFYTGFNVPDQSELRVSMAIEYMRENYTDAITLEDIADKLHISRNECCRCFKRVMGMSIFDYLNRLRIYEAAKVLYKNPTEADSFSGLAFQMGFNNASYFNKIFRRYLLCTPGEYVKMLKQDPDKAVKLFGTLQDALTNI